MRWIGTLLITSVVLVVGAAAGYIYKHVETMDLDRQVSTLQSRLQSVENAAGVTISENEALKAELNARTRLLNDQQARIAELERALQGVTSSAAPTLTPVTPAAPLEAPVVAPAPATPVPPRVQVIPPLPPVRP